MNKIYCILIGMLAGLSGVLAQEVADRGVNAISKQGVEAHLSFLAGDLLEGREAGARGGLLAAGYIKTVLSGLGIAPFFDTYFQPFEAYSRDRQKKTAAFRVHPDSIALYKQEAVQRKLNLENVIGYLEGRRKDEYVIIGAHYDHLGIDEQLDGDKIYNGADDNASGVAAALQIAAAFAAAGETPERSILFAFWDGEELGCLGSEYFAAHFEALPAIKGYINLDMLGRDGTFPSFLKKDTQEEPAPNSFSFLYAVELEKYNEWLHATLDAYQLELTPKPRVLSAKARGSDNYSFSTRNVPVLWFFSGIHPDYHTPADEIEKINVDRLTNLTKAIYLTLRNLANER
jgi:Zn-dependent M28 family amino/carboxypeptidase